MAYDMSAITDAVKKHPAIVIGGGVLLFVVIKMGGSSPASSGGAAVADPNATLSANTQLQMASIAGQNQLQMAGVQANVQLASIAAQRETELAEIAGERALGEQGFAAQLAALTAQTTVAIETLKTGQHNADVNAQTQQLSISKAADVQMAQLQQQTDAIQTITQGQVNMAWINADVMKTGIYATRDVQITQSNNMVEIAEIQADAAGESSMWGTVGSIAGAAMMAFSDRRCKQNIVEMGMQENGLMLYEFEYKPAFAALNGSGRKNGYMADDVEKLYPDAVRTVFGYKMVDYSKVP